MRKKHSKRRMMRYIRNTIVVVMMTCIAIGIGVVLNKVNLIIQEAGTFSIDRVSLYEPFKIYDGNDQIIYQANIDPAKYEDLPECLIDAVISVEDARFFVHGGFDVARITSALLGNAMNGQIASGASTISQQLIKKAYYPSEEQTYTRKIGELALAVQMEKAMDKEYILITYLNTIYYGVGMTPHGIEAASRYYFNKGVQSLTLPEAAYLAGAINAPSAYDAYYHLEEANERRNIVLDLMVRHGYITKEECNLAKSTRVEDTLAYDSSPSNLDHHYQAYIDAIINEALPYYFSNVDEEELYSNQSYYITELTSQPIHIKTFMNPELQIYLEDDIGNEEGDYIWYSDDDVEVAGAVIENYTGRIVGLLGGRDYSDYQIHGQLTAPKVYGFNRATQAKVSPGSSLKPLLGYGAGIELCDWPTYSCIEDKKWDDDKKKLYNWDYAYHGTLTFADALGASWNIPAVKGLQMACNKVGVDEVINYINGLGLTVNDAYDSEGNFIQYGDFSYRYAIGAWSRGVSVVQEAAAYTTLANKGQYVSPHTINTIENLSTHEVIEVDKDCNDQATKAMGEDSAFMILKLMQAANELHYWDFYSYVGNEAKQCEIEYAAKTGTGTNDEGYTKDFVMACLTPDYAMTFWVGKDQSSEAISNYNQLLPHHMCANTMAFLHEENGAQHEFSSCPDNVDYASVYRQSSPEDTYMLASDYAWSGIVSKGYYKKSNPPKKFSLIQEVTGWINTLRFFDAWYDDHELTFSFGDYWRGDGDDRDIEFVAEIRDDHDVLLDTIIGEVEDFTIDYPLHEPVSIVGYYRLADDYSTISNQLAVKIGPQ